MLVYDALADTVGSSHGGTSCRVIDIGPTTAARFAVCNRYES
jgi:hypothetical protein